jgi:hypothetical protein
VGTATAIRQYETLPNSENGGNLTDAIKYAEEVQLLR